ncbi:hypothetical protein ACCO45_000659 [Purpureocillium lilacinum]|uniref:Uncharacterized protein n=1 Tax=Purpureocillium lilacinum TaxID=33203 RepID=A0ACC4E4U0_PURLI
MITASSLSLYSGYYTGRATTQPSGPSSTEQLSSASVAQFLNAAADGPSSPERLRNSNKQMKRVSRLHRQHGHRAASSESSSLASVGAIDAIDRPPWEIALENHFIARRTSIRSNDSSSTPSRDRAESVSNFSKNLFHRRGKSKRESSSHSSSASSIYSVDGPVDTTGVGTKDSIIPAIFSRWKPSRDEAIQEEAANIRSFQLPARGSQTTEASCSRCPGSTAAGFRRPQPFPPFSSADHLPTATSVHHEHVPFVEDGASSPVLGEAYDMAWPLTSPVQGSYDPILSALPDVPEEEEHFGVSRRSRLSLASNNSSLRGSHSVPMLRSLAESQRPMSGASETLGRFERPVAHGVAGSEAGGPAGSEFDMFLERWEDDIDYCYEHEAEADCNYEWGRPSLETARDNNSPPTHSFMDKELGEMRGSGLAQSHPSLLSPTPRTCRA